MLGNLMGKLQEAQKQMEEAKQKLDEINVDHHVENGAVRISSTANKKILSINISDELLKSADKERIEKLLLEAIQGVMEKADEVAQQEMKGVAKGMLPGIPGLF